MVRHAVTYSFRNWAFEHAKSGARRAIPWQIFHHMTDAPIHAEKWRRTIQLHTDLAFTKTKPPPDQYRSRRMKNQMGAPSLRVNRLVSFGHKDPYATSAQRVFFAWELRPTGCAALL